MIALQLRVIAQGIEVLTSSDLVSGSVEIYTAEFEFNDAWNGFTKTALFDYVDGEDPTEVVMPGTSCTIPWEPLEKHGYLRVGVCGVNGTQVMPTVWTELLQIKEGAVAGSIHIEPTGTTYEQVMALLAGIDGGTGGQILAKQSDVDYDFKWVDNPAQYVPGTEGDVVVIGSNSNIADSGISKDNLLIAPQLASNNIKTDSVPYVYRQTGGGIGVGNREYDSIVGGSIVWNQIQKGRNVSSGTSIVLTYTTDGKLTVVVNNPTASASISLEWPTLTKNHKYLMYVPNATKNNGFEYYVSGFSQRGSLDNWVMNYTGDTGIMATLFYVSTRTANGTYELYPMCIDLTVLFGATIADYLYTQDVSTVGYACAYLKRMGLLTEAYSPYTAEPSLLSAMPTAHKTVGFNRFDGNFEVGGIIWTTGVEYASSTSRRTGYIPVFSNTAYYNACTYALGVVWYDASKTFISSSLSAKDTVVTSPSNAVYARLVWTSVSDDSLVRNSCFNISDPARNGTYEPYEEHTYPLDSSLTLRGVSVIDDNNNIKFDGDTYAPDGTVTRRYGIVDLGTLTWYNINASAGAYYTNGISSSKIGSFKYLCAEYKNGGLVVSSSAVATSEDKSIYRQTTNVNFFIRDSAYTSAASMKAALSGVYMIYELADASQTTETAEPYDYLQICDPLGTEEYVITGIVPVGHVTKYPEDQRAKLDGLPSDFSRIIAPTEKAYKATRTYTVGRLLIVNNILYKVISAISSGATLTVGTNISETTLDEVIASL